MALNPNKLSKIEFAKTKMINFIVERDDIMYKNIGLLQKIAIISKCFAENHHNNGKL